MTHFVSIKFKKQQYLGKNAIAIIINLVTGKVIDKLQNLQLMEKKQEMMQAESYKSTISHELRAPLESSALIIQMIIEQF